MSTFYASFADYRTARKMINELVHSGVQPDDLSLIVPEPVHSRNDPQFDLSNEKYSNPLLSVSDATDFVGRADDPDREQALTPIPSSLNYTNLELSPIGGIDTSNSETDVESVDQLEDSQEEADRMTYPTDDKSQSEHEDDDIEFALRTGFPTPEPRIDDFRDLDFSHQESQVDELESITLPHLGTVVGGGSLATVALDFATLDKATATQRIVDHLQDEGVSAKRAAELRDAYLSGSALVAISITPGSTDEGQVERIVENYKGENAALYDAPRYYQGAT